MVPLRIHIPSWQRATDPYAFGRTVRGSAASLLTCRCLFLCRCRHLRLLGDDLHRYRPEARQGHCRNRAHPETAAHHLDTADDAGELRFQLRGGLFSRVVHREL
jgi:hypothetical protein